MFRKHLLLFLTRLFHFSEESKQEECRRERVRVKEKGRPDGRKKSE